MFLRGRYSDLLVLGSSRPFGELGSSDRLAHLLLGHSGPGTPVRLLRRHRHIKIGSRLLLPLLRFQEPAEKLPHPTGHPLECHDDEKRYTDNLRHCLDAFEALRQGPASPFPL